MLTGRLKCTVASRDLVFFGKHLYRFKCSPWRVPGRPDSEPIKGGTRSLFNRGPRRSPIHAPCTGIHHANSSRDHCGRIRPNHGVHAMWK